MNITRTLDSDRVCVLLFDRPNSSANVFDRATLEELDAHLSALESEAGLKGIILASAKPRIFIAGADLNAFAKGVDERVLGEIVDLGHRVFTRLSRLSVPSVAAINGVCLGGGFELALACDWRVASTERSTKIGLPETQLGILPAWGGSVRLPALIGLPAALGMILTGKQLGSTQALKIGIVDQVAHPEYLLDTARRCLTRGKRPTKSRPLVNRAPFSTLVAAKARRAVRAKTGGHYPAPFKAIEVCLSALGQPLEKALAQEKSAFLALVRTPESRNLVNVFFLQERVKKRQIPGTEDASDPIKCTAVVGAGVMGAGIAQWISARGMPVKLVDIKVEILGRGLHIIEKIYRGAVKRHVFTMAEATAGFDRITPVHTNVPLADVDLIVEAAVEKLDLKQAIFKELETHVRPDTVLATNTSALSVDAIADGLDHPERVVGIHFFNPVHRMQLVEVVHGLRTSPLALSKALQFVKSLGKLPVIVKDSPGFLVNRILLPYMIEAVSLFREGSPIVEVDQLMVDFGMPMGPLRLADEVGLDVAQHVARGFVGRLSYPMPLTDVLEKMIAKGWLGKKSGRGFYLHASENAHPKPNAEANAMRDVSSTRAFDAATRLDRMVLLMVNEAARCMAEGVVDEAEDVDFAMIFGTGWAPFRGGPLRYADSLGATEVVKRLDVLVREVAPHFSPCERLREMARDQRKFYPENQSSSLHENT